MAVGTRPEFDYPLAARVAPPTFAPLWMALSSKLSRPPPGHQGLLRGSYPSKTPARIKVALGSNAAGFIPIEERLLTLRVIRRLPVTWQCGASVGRRLISLEGGNRGP